LIIRDGSKVGLRQTHHVSNMIAPPAKEKVELLREGKKQNNVAQKKKMGARIGY